MGGGGGEENVKKKRFRIHFLPHFREYSRYFVVVVVLCFCFVPALIANIVFKSESAFATTE